jgi:transcriptional regulator with AAA-type ATPase domain
MKLNNSYFTDGGNTTKAGMLEFIFKNKPKYLLIDEIDKMSTKDQTFLLNLMETGMFPKRNMQREQPNSVCMYAIANNICGY